MSAPMYPLVAFVASPTVGATARFDFNAAGTWATGLNYPGSEGFSLGSPSLVGDPDALGVEYGPRQLSFTLVIRASKAEATARMSALAKELLRQSNWLMFQMSPLSKPIWFRTYRTAPKEISFASVSDTADTGSDLWELGVTLDAGPFAYGETVVQPTVTVANDPAVPSSPIAAPVVSAPTTATTGGTLAAATYFYVVTSLTSAGESTISNRVSRVTTGSTSTVSLSWTSVTGATGYNVYRSTTSGSEKLLASGVAGTSFTDTGQAAGTQAFPTVNTTASPSPMWFKLPDIQGDAPVPLVVDVKPTVGTWDASSLMLMATTPSLQATPHPQEYPFFINFGTGDGAVTDNGTSPVVTGAAWSGGSARNITFDSAPTNLYQRVSVSASFAAGSYRLMARVSPSDTASAFQLQATAIFSSSDVVTMSAAAVGPRWVDLGLVRVPFGQPNVSPAENIGTSGTILSIMAARTAGSGTLRFDQVAAVPVSLAQDSESSTMVASFPNGGPNTSNWAHIDGQAETASLVSGNSLAFHIYQTTDRAIRGGYPMGYPGRGNSLVLFQQTGEPATRADDLTQSATVVVSYQPRWLYLGAS